MIDVNREGDVWVVAETGRGLYGARQLVKVTIGGCGG